MQVGIEVSNEHGSPRASAVAGMAHAAERLGYATIWARAVGADHEQAAEHLLVAAGAAAHVRVGINGPEGPVLAMLERLSDHRDELHGRLSVALPVGRDGARRRPATLDGAGGIRVGSLVPAGDVGSLGADVLEGFVVVRLELGGACVGDGTLAESTLDQLLAVRTGGVDEVVLAADCVTDVDRTMAAYGVLAEALEMARVPEDRVSRG
jgi:hypothetical protein